MNGAGFTKKINCLVPHNLYINNMLNRPNIFDLWYTIFLRFSSHKVSKLAFFEKRSSKKIFHKRQTAVADSHAQRETITQTHQIPDERYVILLIKPIHRPTCRTNMNVGQSKFVAHLCPNVATHNQIST